MSEPVTVRCKICNASFKVEPEDAKKKYICDECRCRPPREKFKANLADLGMRGPTKLSESGDSPELRAKLEGSDDRDRPEVPTMEMLDNWRQAQAEMAVFMDRETHRMRQLILDLLETPEFQGCVTPVERAAFIARRLLNGSVRQVAQAQGISKSNVDRLAGAGLEKVQKRMNNILRRPRSEWSRELVVLDRRLVMEPQTDHDDDDLEPTSREDLGELHRRPDDAYRDEKCSFE